MPGTTRKWAPGMAAAVSSPPANGTSGSSEPRRTSVGARTLRSFRTRLGEASGADAAQRLDGPGVLPGGQPHVGFGAVDDATSDLFFRCHSGIHCVKMVACRGPPFSRPHDFITTAMQG